MAVAERMEVARNLSNGTMPVDVVFATEAEVKEAEAWMKGKHKAKLLTPMTRDEADRRSLEALAKITAALRKREQWGKK